MDNRTEKHIQETIQSASDVDDSPERVRDREKRLDAEIGYEALAVTSSMGMLGMNEESANLIELELAEQLMYKSSLQNDEPTE